MKRRPMTACAHEGVFFNALGDVECERCHAIEPELPEVEPVDVFAAPNPPRYSAEQIAALVAHVGPPS